jgi:hypothetical protein
MLTTYRKILLELNDNAIEKYNALLKADKKLVEEADGAFDIIHLDKMSKTYIEWQIAQNEFVGMVAFVKKMGIDLDTELNIP